MGYFGGTRQDQGVWGPELKARIKRLSLFAIFLGAFTILLVALMDGEGGSFSLLPEGLFHRRSVTIQSQSKSPIVKAEVLVATEPVTQGTRLRSNMFKLDVRPITGIEDQVLKDLSAVRNQYAVAPISVDSIVLKEQIGKNSPTNIITSRIPDGFRAVSIPVDAESGVEGWARPGARVDVVWSTQHRGKQLVSTIVENAEVLSAERSTENDTAAAAGAALPTHITLLVTIKDAQRIQLAKTSGALSLNLRGDSDDSGGNAETISIDKLLRPIVAENIGEAQGKVVMGGKEYVLTDGRLIPSDEFEKEDREDSKIRNGTFGSEARARLKIDGEKEKK